MGHNCSNSECKSAIFGHSATCLVFRRQVINSVPSLEPIDLKGEEFIQCVKWAKSQGNKLREVHFEEDSILTSPAQQLIAVFIKCNQEKEFWKQYEYTGLLKAEVFRLETGRLSSLQLWNTVFKILKDGREDEIIGSG